MQSKKLMIVKFLNSYYLLQIGCVYSKHLKFALHRMNTLSVNAFDVSEQYWF